MQACFGLNADVDVSDATIYLRAMAALKTHQAINMVSRIEHVQRIGRYAKLVGRENVIAGSDCGYGTWVGQAAVDPAVVWAKFRAMAEGARLASQQFWP